jgi:hypothetical protein
LARSVPPAARKAAQGHESDQGNDQPDPEAPDEHQDNADDDDDPAQRYSAAGSVTTLWRSHAFLLQAWRKKWSLRQRTTVEAMSDSLEDALPGGLQREPSVSRRGYICAAFRELKAVWFKDPDGNILNVINESI